MMNSGFVTNRQTYTRVTTHIRQTDEMKTLDRKKCMPIAMITFKTTHKQGKKYFSVLVHDDNNIIGNHDAMLNRMTIYNVYQFFFSSWQMESLYSMEGEKSSKTTKTNLFMFAKLLSRTHIHTHTVYTKQ